MCFSATASFVAGTGLLAVGVFTLRRARSASEVPYAAIPALFGVQQLVEGAIWLTAPGSGEHANSVLTHAYAFFSHILWPMFVPLAVMLIEPDRARRRLLAGLTAAGAAAGGYLAFYWVADPTTSVIEGEHILYISPHFYIAPILALYVAGTCASPLVSSHAAVRWFGVAASASLLAALAFYATWFISVWCFFAAIVSLAVTLYFRRGTALARDTHSYG